MMFGGVRPVGESRGQSVEADAEMDVVVVSWFKTYGRYIGTIPLLKANLLSIFLERGHGTTCNSKVRTTLAGIP
jgi:hypothetical protein